MSMVLLNAILLPFALLVGVPLLLHLFARSRPPVYKFSSTEFIRRVLRFTMRVKRPQDLIILVLRTILVALLILMFLRPLLFSRHGFAGTSQQRNVVLIIDATASMAYADGAQNRFAEACAEASEILSGLTSRDTANIIWLDAEPHAEFPAMGVNIGYLQTALRKARVTDEAGNIDEAFRLAETMLKDSEGDHEICVVSDFQRSTWSAADVVIPQGVKGLFLSVNRSDAENCAVTDVHCDPPTPLFNEEVMIYGDIHNFSASPKQRTVFLGVGERRLSQNILIPAWGHATALFRHSFTQKGVQPLHISITEDFFNGDDQRWSLVDVHEFLTVGMLGEDQPTGQAWLRALNALEWVRVEPLNHAKTNGEIPQELVMLAGWNGTLVSELERALARGQTIVCEPSPEIDPALLSSFMWGVESGRRVESVRWFEARDALTLAVKAEKDPLFKMFAAGEYGDPASGRVLGRLEIGQQPVGDNAEVLLAYSDGAPALVRFLRSGTLYFWNVPLDQKWSNWAAQPEFLPLLGELLLTSRTRVQQRTDLIPRQPGELLSWSLDSGVMFGDVLLMDGSGSKCAIKAHHGAFGGSAISESNLGPGLYTWLHQSKRVGYTAVNFPESESDLREMANAEVEQFGVATATRGNRVRRLREGTHLWPFLLGLGVALALVEGAALLWAEST